MEPTPKANSTHPARAQGLVISDVLDAPRVLKFPARAPASSTLPPPPVRDDADDSAPAVLCDLGAYRRLTQRMNDELDRMQRGLDRLMGDADSYRFPSPADDSPRPAA